MIKNKAGVVIRKTENGQTQVLLLLHNDVNIWHLPKGHMEKGESAETAAIREAKEETGCDINLIKPLRQVHYIDTDKNEVFLNMFLAEITSGDITPEHDKCELHWVKLQEAAAKLTFKDMKDFIVESADEILK